MRKGGEIRGKRGPDHTLPIDPDRRRVNGIAAMGEAGGRSIGADLTQGKLLGNSPGMEAIRVRLSKFARTDAPVLITGESGTGKELAAQQIHQGSRRAAAPLVVINSGALPASLIQSELFGHEKGAFTGACQRQIGRIETAAGGSLFLDEIGDLPLDLQANLLRVLQEGYIERVGNTRTIPVDVRIIAATNVNLPRAIAEGRFRNDLYYRLNVLHIEMPPLRGRGEDIALLAQHFLLGFANEMRSNVSGFSNDALRAMQHHDWPGNVRELMNRIQKATAICETRLIEASDLDLERRNGASWLLTLVSARAEVEQRVIKAALLRTSSNVSEAARQLGVSRGALYLLIEKHGIEVRHVKTRDRSEVGATVDDKTIIRGFLP